MNEPKKNTVGDVITINGDQYRLKRPQSDAGNGLTNIAVYEKAGDTAREWMLAADGLNMLPMTPGGYQQ